MSYLYHRNAPIILCIANLSQDSNDKTGNIIQLVNDFWPFLFLFVLILLIVYLVYDRIKSLARFTTKLPELDIFTTPVSDKLGVAYAKPSVNWDALCKVNYFYLVLVLLASAFLIFCSLENYWCSYFPSSLTDNEYFNGNLFFYKFITISNLQFYRWSGLFFLVFGSLWHFGYPRFWRHLREIMNKPGRQGVITINRAGYCPYKARIDRVRDGPPADSKLLYLRTVIPPSFPRQLPLTDKAEVFYDEATGKPVAFWMCGGLFYVQGSSLLQRSVLMPWRR